MTNNSGIFIRSLIKDAGLILRGCESLLEIINCHGAEIKALTPDDEYGGFRAYFNDDSVVASFLKFKNLPLSEDVASIHSLTAKLVVHNVIPQSTQDFKEELEGILKRLGPVLAISHIPIFPDRPHIESGDWIVELDMPEIEDFYVFENFGLPYTMNIQVTSKTKNNTANQDISVTFYCCLCNGTDHSREHCPCLKITPTGGTDESASLPEIEDTEISPTTFPKIHSVFEIRDHNLKNPSPSSSSKSAKQHRIEAIASDLERKKTQSQSSGPNYFTDESKIKQEPEDEAFDKEGSSVSMKRPLRGKDNGKRSKKLRFATNLENRSSNDDDTKFDVDHTSTASSTTGRDGVSIAYDASSPPLPTIEMPKESGIQTCRRNSYLEDPNVPNLPTSSQPENFCDPNLTGVPVQESSDHSDSNGQMMRTRRATRKKPTYAPVVLPDRIKEIVLAREQKEGELDVGQLEAFFNHVKKKMSPAKIALQFTSNVKGLYEQLKDIVKKYYMTPKVGSFEDSRFMKWLEGMLERFDSVPSKRKKPKQEPMY